MLWRIAVRWRNISLDRDLSFIVNKFVGKDHEVFLNIWKIIYLSCGEKYEDIIDNRSYTHNFMILHTFTCILH